MASFTSGCWLSLQQSPVLLALLHASLDLAIQLFSTVPLHLVLHGVLCCAVICYAVCGGTAVSASNDSTSDWQELSAAQQPKVDAIFTGDATANPKSIAVT